MSVPRAVPFEPGQIVVLGAGPAHDRRWYRTSVTHVDARMVWLDGAPAEQPLLDVQLGQEVTCHTWRAMDALYEAEARVALTRLAPDPLVGLVVQRAERIQQREYVRVPLSAEASGVYLGPSEAATLARPQPLRLKVVDLSASGLRGRGDLLLLPGDELEIELPLPGTQNDAADVPIHLRRRLVSPPGLPAPLNLRARVVRLVEGVSSADDPAHEIGVTFVDVSRDLRERIIRYALDVQRDRRRRGMM
jgi:hypothetical protein